MILGMIGKTVRGVRRLRGRPLRESVRDYVDEALASYGYTRRMGGLAGVVPLVGAFGAGVAVGTGIGVLVAPRSGKETRELLGRRLRDLATKMTREETVPGDGRGGIVTDDPEITRGRGRMGHS